MSKTVTNASLFEALKRISELTPGAANAATARDMHLTVKAIADCALMGENDADREAATVLVEAEAKRRCIDAGYSLDRMAREDRRFRHDDTRPWWKANYVYGITADIERLRKAGFVVLPAAAEEASPAKPDNAPHSEPRAYLVDGNVEQGLFFDRPSAEIMAEANCGTVMDLYTEPPSPAPAMAEVDFLTVFEKWADGMLIGQPDRDILRKDVREASHRLAAFERAMAEGDYDAIIEEIAQWLHDETDHQERCIGYTWPESDRDDGRRGNGWVKIVPQHAQEYFREMARRLVAGYGNLIRKP